VHCKSISAYLPITFHFPRTESYILVALIARESASGWLYCFFTSSLPPSHIWLSVRDSECNHTAPKLSSEVDNLSFATNSFQPFLLLFEVQKCLIIIPSNLHCVTSQRVQTVKLTKINLRIESVSVKICLPVGLSTVQNTRKSNCELTPSLYSILHIFLISSFITSLIKGFAYVIKVTS